MTHVTLRQLRYFNALARHGHFGRAAEACAISQPAMSMQIKELEEALGGVLLERSARQVALTNVGEEAAQRVNDILRLVDELGDLARASRDRLVGRLRIGMIPTVAPYLLPEIIGNLTRMHPELDIHVRETLTPKLIQELADGRLDTAIVALPVSEPSLAEVALFSEHFLLVRPGEDEGAPVPSSKALRAAGGAGREFPVDARADGRRRHRRHFDPGNGRGGGDALGVGVCRSLQKSATLANHWHDLAQDESSGQAAPAIFRSGLPLGRRVAQAARSGIGIPQSPDLNALQRVAIPRNLFADILRLITELRSPPLASTAQSDRAARVRAKLQEKCVRMGSIVEIPWRTSGCGCSAAVVRLLQLPPQDRPAPVRKNVLFFSPAAPGRIGRRSADRPRARRLGEQGGEGACRLLCRGSVVARDPVPRRRRRGARRLGGPGRSAGRGFGPRGRVRPASRFGRRFPERMPPE
jgi:DNA-binding transcriptional LysR family regulator